MCIPMHACMFAHMPHPQRSRGGTVCARQRDLLQGLWSHMQVRVGCLPFAACLTSAPRTRTRCSDTARNAAFVVLLLKQPF
jgi:hypothetical protein